MDINDVIAVIAETGVKSDMDAFDPEKSFDENGIDSLDTFTILLALEEKTGVALEGVSLDEVNSAATLQAYIAAKAA